MLDLYGRIVLEDVFSAPLDSLTRKSREAAGAVAASGKEAANALTPLSTRIAQLETQITSLRAKSSAGLGLSVGELQGFKAASSELNNIRTTMAGISGDPSAARVTARIAELRAQIDGIKTRGLSGTLTVGDIQGVTKAESELKRLVSVRDNMFGKIDTASLTNASKRMEELTTQVTAFRTKVASGVQVSVGEVRDFQRANSELRQLKTTYDSFAASAAQSPVNARIKQLGDQVAAAKVKAATGPGLTVGELQGAKAAQSELRGLQDSLLALGDTRALESVNNRMRELGAQVDAFKTKARTKTGLTMGEMDDFKSARSELIGLQGELGGLQGKATGSSNAMATLGKATFLVGFAFAGLRAADAAADIVRVGASATTQRTALENLGRSSDVNTQKLVAGMNSASRGTMDNVALMTTANRSLLAGGQVIADKLPRLFEIARAASLATGSDINYVFTTLVKGIIRASPLLIDNADIYLKIGQAVDLYAEKVGKSRTALSAQERQIAVLNAVLDQGGKFVSRMGVDSDTAADKMQKLPASVANLKISLGELAVAMGAADFASNLAGVIQTGNEYRRLDTVMKDLVGTMEAMGASEAHGSALQQFRAGVSAAWQQFDSSGMTDAASVELNRSLADQIAILEVRKRKLQETLDPEVAFRNGMIASEAAMAANRDAYYAADVAITAYTNALEAAEQQTSGIEAAARGAASVIAQVGTINFAMPKAPEVSGLFTTDTTELRAYMAELNLLDPQFAKVTAAMEMSVAALEGKQAATIAAMRADTDSAAALDRLAKSLYGQGASLLDLVTNLDKLPPPLQSAVQAMDLLDLSLSRVRSNAAQPISIDVRVKGLESALGEIDSMALRLVGIMDPTEIREFRDAANSEVAASWDQIGREDAFGMELKKRTILKGYEEIISGTEEHYKEIEQMTKSHYTNLADSAEGLKGMIEEALKSGLEVTPEQMAATKAGQYVDVALENARRAKAIMERGFAELELHPDWAGALKIPEDVLNGSEDALKAWAGRLSSSIANLERPDLINWDAFTKQYEQQQNVKAAQELTIDIAIGKLDAAGLLKGLSPAERRKKVAQALGLQAPELTLDAMFAPKGTPGDLVKKFLNGKDSLEVDTTLRVKNVVYEPSLLEKLQQGPQQPGPKVPPELTPEEKLRRGPQQPEFPKTPPRQDEQLWLKQGPPQPQTPERPWWWDLKNPVQLPTPQQTLLQGPQQPPFPGLQQQLTPQQMLLQGPQQPIPAPKMDIDWTAQAAVAASGFSSSLVQVFQTQSLAIPMSSAISSDFDKNKSSFEKIGASSAGVMMTAWRQAVFDNVGSIRKDIAMILAPEVAEILERNKSGGNSKP